MGRNGPNVSKRIGEGSGTISIELILYRLKHLCSGSNCLLGYLVAIVVIATLVYVFSPIIRPLH